MKKRFIEIAVKVVVAALTAFLTAITTTSCMGLGPITLEMKSIQLLSWQLDANVCIRNLHIFKTIENHQSTFLRTFAPENQY